MLKIGILYWIRSSPKSYYNMNKSKIDKLLSVIIVSYNSLKYVKGCLKSIFTYNDIGDSLEVIVVDNSPNHETKKWIDRSCYNVITIKNGNKGFGEANNLGAKNANGKYLLFLNPDTELLEPVFSFAVNRFQINPNLGCFGVQLVDEKGRNNYSFGLRNNRGFMLTMTDKLLSFFNLFISRFMFISGANIFIEKKAFEDCGMFDENIFLYYEEADLCNRLNLIGKTNKFFSEKKILHYEGKASEKSLFNSYAYALKSREYYCKKFGINFEEEIRKELKYCKFKILFFNLLNIKTRRLEYYKIVSLLNKKLGLKRG